MTTIHVAISPKASEFRVLALSGPNETILKARLSKTPAHPRAMATLLEAIALWEGARVHVALCAESRAGASELDLYRRFDLESSPLVDVEWVPASRRVRPRRELTGVGDFGDLRQLMLEEVWR